MIGRPAQPVEGEAHRFVGRAQNINLIDLDGVDDANAPKNILMRHQLVIDFLTQLGQQLFRVLQFPVPEFLWQNHRRRHHWPSQRAAARFINSRDANDTKGAQSFFLTKTAAPVHRPKIIRRFILCQ